MSSIARPYDFIAGKDLVSLLTKDGKEKIAVVDVRDSVSSNSKRSCSSLATFEEK